ncbi:MAG TPA: hypothetical protein VMP01_20630 [Pirellulaceae bacterium]|nr:hypothetical protein [Pirellulaceae bacterium]
MTAIDVPTTLIGAGIAAAVTIALVVRAYRGQRAVTAADLVLALAVVVVLACVHPQVALQGLFSLVVAIICLVFSLRHRSLIAAVWLALVLSIGLSHVARRGRVWDLHRLRAQYPFVPLTDRLAYEDARNRGESAEKTFIQLAEPVEKRLAKLEKDSNTSRRYMLERLHDAQYERFIAAPGFGLVRTRRVNEQNLELWEKYVPPEGTPKSLPLAAAVKSEQPLPLEAEIAPDAPFAFPQPLDLEDSADRARKDFLNPDRFGYVRGREASGFVSHQLMHLPSLGGSTTESEAWQLDRLELVSLLKSPQPAVYLSDELPNMERLANVPTRPLNEFEREALSKLRTDEDLVVRYSANTIRMLGSLRAGKTCLECHSVQRGALLGAFSYELRRTTPVPVPEEQPAKPKPEA